MPCEHCSHCHPKPADILEEGKKLIEDLLSTPLPPKVRQKLDKARAARKRALTVPVRKLFRKIQSA